MLLLHMLHSEELLRFLCFLSLKSLESFSESVNNSKGCWWFYRDQQPRPSHWMNMEDNNMRLIFSDGWTEYCIFSAALPYFL